MTMNSLGNKMFRVTATDTAGNITTKDVPYMVNSVDYTRRRPAAARVDSMMALTLPSSLQRSARSSRASRVHVRVDGGRDDHVDGRRH